MKQLSVFVLNEIGSISKVTTVLKENQINLKAIASFDSPDFGILRIVVDQPEKAKDVLTAKGFAVKVSEVVAVELEDRPGGLDSMLCTIADENITVNYIYSFVLRNQKSPLMVVNTNDLEKTEKILNAHGFQVASQQELQ